MSVTIQIPTPLRGFAQGNGEIQVEASTVGEALGGLVRRYPDLAPHLYAETGELRSFVNVFVNSEDSRHLQGDATPVAAGDTLIIVPSIAGGVPVATAEPPPAATPAAAPAVELTAAEIRRYSRHLILPEVGVEGQKRLKAARVLMIGAGGLGSPLGLYLAAAGVGTLGLVDFDVVDESNLQRQLLYGQKDLGRPKIEAAAERLRDVNPHIRVEPHPARLTSENALDLFAGYDLVVDGTDNFPTRYLVNDACVLTGKPNVYGSIFRFEGQVAVFWGARGPCYRCLFPEPPPPGLVPSCAEGGVLGVLPGIIGALQANEVTKLILGVGEPLIGRLVLFDALRLKFRELKLRKNPDCPVCGEHPTLTQLIDYEQFCGLGRGEAEPPAAGTTAGAGASAAGEEDGMDDGGWEVSVGQLKAWLDAGRKLTVLDVRNPPEYQICRIEGSKLIPLPELPRRVLEIDPRDFIVAYCHTGVRSLRATQLLRSKGFRATNLAGGIDAWSREIDPAVPRY
jgi:adenylyltransferase/sulfurtransferase